MDPEKEMIERFMEHMRGAREKIPVWFVFTHVSMVDDRIREEVIERFKRELHIQTGDECFQVDSIEWRSGRAVVDRQGTEELYGKVRKHLKDSQDHMQALLANHESRSVLLYHALQGLWELASANRQSLLLIGGSLLSTFLGLRSLYARL